MPRQIKFKCIHCGTKLAVPPQMAGVSDYCPKCGGLITSPTLSEWNASLNAAAIAAQKAKIAAATGEVSTTAKAKSTDSAQVESSTNEHQECTPPHAPLQENSDIAQPAADTDTNSDADTETDSGWTAAELADALSPPPSTKLASKLSDTDRFDNPSQPADSFSGTTQHSSEPSSRPFVATSPPSPNTSPPTHSEENVGAVTKSANPPSLLSRMLSISDTIQRVPPSQAVQSTSTSEQEPPTTSAQTDPPDDPDESYPEESLEEDDAIENMDHEVEKSDAYGMGQMLAQHHTAQPTSSLPPASQDRKWRSTPFLSVDELKSANPRRGGLRRKVLFAVCYFLMFEVLLLAIFRKQVVAFWYTHGPGSWKTQAAEHQASPPPVPPPLPGLDSSSNDISLPPSVTEPSPITPDSQLDAPAKPRSEKPTSSTPSAQQPVESAEVFAAMVDEKKSRLVSGESAPVPQAIPITEDQLAKLPSSSLAMPNTVPSAEKSAAMPAAENTTPSTTPKDALEQDEAPFAVSDAWVFGPPSPEDQPPAITNPVNKEDSPTQPAAMTAEVEGGLPLPPADMALPNGPPADSSSASSTQTVASHTSPSTPSNHNAVAAPPASTSIQTPTTNKIPAEAKPAFDSLLAFIKAPNWKERAKYSLRGNALSDAMSKHAKTHGDGPINVSTIEFIERHTPSGGLEPYCMFEVRGPDLPHGVLTLVSQPKNKMALVDWESFMEFRHDYLLKFLETPGAPKQSFRVMLRRKHYFDKDVPGIDKMESFQITQPYVDTRFEGNVFLQKSSALSKTLSSQLPWGMDMPVIIELTWKSSQSQQWVEIVSIPHYGWRKS